MRGIGSWRQIRLGLALVAFVITLAALIGGQGLAHSIGVNRPLAKEMSAIKGVKDYRLVQEKSGGNRLELTLTQVPDLETTLTEAVNVLETRQKQAITEIVVHDHRQGLEKAYYELRFSLEEADATGRYTQLLTSLDGLRRRDHLGAARIYLGTRFVFVQLEKGHAYLYEALPRTDRVQQVQTDGGAM